jgi:hypothetical protein
LDNIYETHQDNMTIIHYHAWWPSANDPYHLANPTENTARITYYPGDLYTPHTWIDGDIDGQYFPSWWESQITNEEGVPSPMTIDLTANYGDVGDYGTMTAVITATDSIEYSNLKVRFSITESHLPGIGGFDEFNQVMRDMVPDASGLDLAISEGEEVTKEVDFVLSNDWDFSNLDFVVFVQSDMGKRILQADRLTPPSGVLRGLVTSTESGFPVPNAQVAILNTTYGDLSDSQGNYSFAFLPGNRTIIAGAGGFNPDTIDVFIVSGDTTDLDIALEPGATSSLTGTLTDPTSAGAIKANVTLFMNGDSLATVESDSLTGVFTFDGITVSTPPWVVYTDLRVDPFVPYPIVNYGDTINVAEGTPTIVDFDISPAEVFLVDDDGGDTYETYFKDEITSTGRTYHHYDVDQAGESAVNHLGLFPLTSSIVWFTGDATSNTLSESEQDSLAKYLDDGGQLFLTGQNIAEDLDATGSNFLQDYLHVSHDGNSTYLFGRGIWGNPVTGYLQLFVTAGGGGANNQNSRDILVPTAPATEFIKYVSSPTDQTNRGTAAVYVEGTGSSKAILMGFGLESVAPGDTTRATREQTMLAILNWFDGIADIGDGDDPGGEISLPKAFTLQQNYPNPFNPSTTIRYAIPVASENKTSGVVSVQLSLYDLRGRLIKTLVESDQKPGSYTVHWDGTDSRNDPVGSGIFIYRLKAGDQVLTRKMTIIR